MALPVDPILFLSFIGATVLLVATPGPVVGLMIARTLADGRSHGFVIVLGAATAAILYLTIALTGFQGLQALDPRLFTLIQYLGAAYMVFLAYKAWTTTPDATPKDGNGHASLWKDYRRGMLVTLSSPKSLLFFGAFFPLFLSQDLPAGPQLWTMSVAFIIVSMTIDSCTILLAGWARKTLLDRGAQRTIARVSGTCLALGALLILML